VDHERFLGLDGVDSRDDEAKPLFNVAIVYDGRSAGARAMDIFARLTRQFYDEFEFHCDLWRFDMLTVPEEQEAAVRAGDGAALIIVASQCEADLPASVINWLDRCLVGKAPGSAALVALLESQQRFTDVRARTREFLRRSANQGRLEFFLHEVDVSHSMEGLMPKALEQRASAVSPALQKTVHACLPLSRRRT
jgi:hypothetical protein